MNSDIAKLAVEVSGPVENFIDEFDRWIYTGGKVAREKLGAVVEESVRYCADHFYKGIAMSDSEEVARWGAEWNQCSLLLLNLMTSAPKILVEKDLMRVCLDMTRGKDFLFHSVMYYIENKKTEMVDKIFEAGYQPIIDSQALSAICYTKDVSRCSRSHFEKLAVAALKSMRRDPMLLHPAPQLAAISGRYISCSAPGSNAIEDFKKNLWPEVKRLTDYTDKDIPLFLQNAIAQYPSKRAMSLVNSLKESYRSNPFLLLSLMEQRYKNFYGRDFNPYGANDVKYDVLKPDFFSHDVYFESILNDRMVKGCFWGTFPKVIQSKFDYSVLPSYIALKELSSRSMMELLQDELSLKAQAAVLMKLAPLERAEDIMQGTEGWIVRYMLQSCMRNIYDACDLPPVETHEFCEGFDTLSIEEKISIRQQLDELERLKKISEDTVVRFDFHTLQTAQTLAQCTNYLSKIESINLIEHALSYCSIVSKNSHIGNPKKEHVLTQVSWHSTSLRDSIFSTDLGV